MSKPKQPIELGALSADTLEHLRRAKEHSPLDGATRARLHSRLQASLGPAFDSSLPTRGRLHTGAAGLSSFVKGTLVGVTVGAAVGAGVEHQRVARSVPPSPPVVQVEASAPASPMVEAAAPSPIVPPAPSAAAAPAPLAPKTEPPAVRSQRERQLIETARLALLRGDLVATAAALGEHQSRYHDGELGEERDSLLVQLLIAKGELPGARARAEVFHRRYPQSLFWPAMNRALQNASEAKP